MGWTDWIREVERNRDALERIVALLLALAGLADRASGLPAARRLDLLCILGHGAAEARAFVTGAAFGRCEEGGETGFHTVDDAARLAAGFRALALLLAAILARAGRIARWLRREARVKAGLPTVRRKLIEPQGRIVRYAARGPPPSRVRTEITPP